MHKCLMMVSLLSLSAVSVLAQPAHEFFKLRSTNAQSVLEAQGTCQPVADMIASFAPALGGTSASFMQGYVRITFLNDKRTVTLMTQPQQTHCIATLTCDNPQGGGAEDLCQQIERMVQELQRKSLPQR